MTVEDTRQITAARHAVLSEVVLRIAETTDLQRLLDEFVGDVKRILDFDRCTLAMLDGDQLHHVPALAVDAVDTTGAGDVFRAAFIYAFLQSQSPVEILKFAVAAAAVSCTREGAMTSVPALAEIQPLLIHTPHAR